MTSTVAAARSVGLLCLVATIVSGCATPHEWLTPESFVTDQRMVEELQRIESRLEEHTAARADGDAATRARLDGLHADLATLASNVRRIERAVKDLDAASRPTASNQAQQPLIAISPSARTPDEKMVIGRVEWVGLPSLGTYLKARVDTGASLSSLSAKDITIFERNGRRWVRFRLGLTDKDSVVPLVRDAWFEFRIRRFVRIVQASGMERRPVVRLPVMLGPIEQQIEFTLNDRTSLSHPVLLGRRFMMDLVMVDVSQIFSMPRPEFPGGELAEQAVRDQADEEELVD